VNQPTVILLHENGADAMESRVVPVKLIALECVSVQEGHSCVYAALLWLPESKYSPAAVYDIFCMSSRREREGAPSGLSITHNVPLIKRCGNEICLPK
jgi:hypothetical protein